MGIGVKRFRNLPGGSDVCAPMRPFAGSPVAGSMRPQRGAAGDPQEAAEILLDRFGHIVDLQAFDAGNFVQDPANMVGSALSMTYGFSGQVGCVGFGQYSVQGGETGGFLDTTRIGVRERSAERKIEPAVERLPGDFSTPGEMVAGASQPVKVELFERMEEV